MQLPTTADIVELIEAVRIDDPHGWPAWTDTVPGTSIGVWEDAQEVLALVTALPAAPRMRCFVPGYALRARTGEHPVFPRVTLFEIAFCFRCNGAWSYGPAVTGDKALAHQTFDPASAPARALLDRFRRANAALQPTD
ncbi:hypothetical protein OH807_34455 [Kitasatospora sp. NBC_01560]|uniref:hypothetical protein n=1 Tax=Kitasatospora sp. NBC_01560 TaxID=2975965 RepID=UPI00386980E0